MRIKTTGFGRDQARAGDLTRVPCWRYSIKSGFPYPHQGRVYSFIKQTLGTYSVPGVVLCMGNTSVSLCVAGFTEVF